MDDAGTLSLGAEDIEDHSEGVRIARVPDAVLVAVLLQRIESRAARIAKISDTVQIPVRLVRVRNAAAIVTPVDDHIPREVPKVVRTGTQVAGVAATIEVRVVLVGIGDRRTI